MPPTISRVTVKRLAPALALALALFACSKDPALERFKRAEDNLGKGLYPEALSEYSAIVNDHRGTPYAPKSQLRIAFIYDQFGNKKRAMDAYYTLCFVYPKSAEAAIAREALAKISSDAGEHSKAIEEYHRLMDLKPDERRRIQYRIALEYLKMGDIKQARVELTEVAKTSDGNLLVEAQFQLANTYYLEGDGKKAIDAYDRLVSRFPKHPLALEALLFKARTLEESGRLEDALDILRGLEDDYPSKDAVRSRITLIETRISERPTHTGGGR